MLAEFRKNKRREDEKKNFLSTILLLFLGAGILTIVGLLIIGNIKVGKRRSEIDTKADSLKKEIQELEEKQKLLQAQILEMGGDDYLEEKARNDLNFKKKDEKTYIIK